MAVDRVRPAQPGRAKVEAPAKAQAPVKARAPVKAQAPVRAQGPAKAEAPAKEVVLVRGPGRTSPPAHKRLASSFASRLRNASAAAPGA